MNSKLGIILINFILCTFILNAQIQVFSDFENANVNLLSLDTASNSIVFSPDLDEKNTQKIWFYFGVSNAKDKTLNFYEVNKYLYSPTYFAFSYDQKNWFRVRSSLMKDSIKVKIKSERDTLYVASCIPYTYTKLLNFLNSIKSPFFQLDTLCISENGNYVPLVIIKDTAFEPKNMIWIIVRQHAFESHANFVLEGFIQKILEDSSHTLLKRTIVYIVPMMDVDNVIKGQTGRGQLPVDFNRDWTTHSHWIAVKSVKDSIKAKQNYYDLKIFFDWHTTFPSNFSYYFSYLNIYKPNSMQFKSLKNFWDIYNTISEYKITRATIPYENKTFFADQYFSNSKINNEFPILDSLDFSCTVEFDCNFCKRNNLCSIKDYQRIGADIATALSNYFLYLP